MHIQTQPSDREEEVRQQGSAPASQPAEQAYTSQDDVAREIAITPGCVIGGFALLFLLVALAGGGLWAAGQFGGVGPFAAASSGAPSSGPVPETAVAMVNGEPITTQELDHLVAVNMVMTSVQNGQPMTLTQQQRQQARMELLEQAIRNTLVLQAAERAGVNVSEDQVQAEWLAWVRQTGMTLDQVDAQFAQAGISREGFQSWLHSALIANQYLTQYVAQGNAPQERTQAYEDWMQQQLETSEIQIFQQPGTSSNINPGSN